MEIHDPRRIVSGFVDYMGLASLFVAPVSVRSETDAEPNAAPPPTLAVLRIGLIVTDSDLQVFTPFLEDLVLAVDGISFRVRAYIATPADDSVGHIALTLSCVAFDLADMTDTTFEHVFESRSVNVEFTDTRLTGTRFVDARYNGKPLVESMYGTHGGGTGRVSDMMGLGMLSQPQSLKHVAVRNLSHWHLTVTFEEWSRKPAWHLYDTIFVNGMAATVIKVYSDSECDVVVPPKLRALTVLTLDPPTGPLAVNIEISSLAYVLSMGKLFRTKTSTDEYFMRLAMNEGDRGRTASGPNAWTGAVLVDNATRLVIGSASCNSIDGTHAEVACIEQAKDAWPERFAGTDSAINDNHLHADQYYSSSSDGGSDEDSSMVHTIDTSTDSVGMTLYVTHMPCTKRTGSNNLPVTSCGLLLGNYRDVLFRIVIGVNDHAGASDDLVFMNKMLPLTTLDVLPADTELAAELRWTLREYTHWRLTKLPYTTGLLIKTIDGHPLSRSTPTLIENLEPFLRALRTLAQAVIIDGDTLMLSPTAFDGLEPHEAVQLIIRAPRGYKTSGKSNNSKMRTRVIKQPFPLRVLVATPLFSNATPEQRAAWLPNTEALGAAMVYTTLDCTANDIHRQSDLLDELESLTTFSIEDQKALQETLNSLWTSKPTVQMTGKMDKTSTYPDPLAIFYEIGQRGVVTAFVEGSDVFLQSLMNRGLINELIVLTVPTMSTTTSPSVKAVEPNLYRLTLVASGQVGDTDMALVHYMVVTHASSGSNMPSDKKK